MSQPIFGDSFHAADSTNHDLGHTEHRSTIPNDLNGDALLDGERSSGTEFQKPGQRSQSLALPRGEPLPRGPSISRAASIALASVPQGTAVRVAERKRKRQRRNSDGDSSDDGYEFSFTNNANAVPFPPRQQAGSASNQIGMDNGQAEGVAPDSMPGSLSSTLATNASTNRIGEQPVSNSNVPADNLRGKAQPGVDSAGPGDDRQSDNDVSTSSQHETSGAAQNSAGRLPTPDSPGRQTQDPPSQGQQAERNSQESSYNASQSVESPEPNATRSPSEQPPTYENSTGSGDRQHPDIEMHIWTAYKEDKGDAKGYEISKWRDTSSKVRALRQAYLLQLQSIVGEKGDIFEICPDKKLAEHLKDKVTEVTDSHKHVHLCDLSNPFLERLLIGIERTKEFRGGLADPVLRTKKKQEACLLDKLEAARQGRDAASIKVADVEKELKQAKKDRDAKEAKFAIAANALTDWRRENEEDKSAT